MENFGRCFHPNSGNYSALINNLAIYTGFRFEPELTLSPTVHVPTPPRPRDPWGNVYTPDYVWGMFTRAPDRTYLGNNFLRIFLTKDLRCVDRFSIFASYQLDPDPIKE